MNRYAIWIFTAVLSCTCAAQAQMGNPISNDAKTGYTSIKGILIKSLDKMPEENYGFRTVPPVRTYGEMILHIADVQMALCGMVKGEQKKADTAGKTSKADIAAALKASFDYCDPLYDGMTDAEGAKTVKMFGHDTSKLGVLNFNIAHDNEMYGQMVAYMRIKGQVPPSSEGRM